MNQYVNQSSPYARKARIVVREKSLDERVTLVDVDPWDARTRTRSIRQARRRAYRGAEMTERQFRWRPRISRFACSICRSVALFDEPKVVNGFAAAGPFTAVGNNNINFAHETSSTFLLRAATDNHCKRGVPACGRRDAVGMARDRIVLAGVVGPHFRGAHRTD